MARKGFSPSQPQPTSASASTTGSRASATMFFSQLPKTDNICIDCLYQQYQSMKDAKKCFQLRYNDKNSFPS